MLKWRKHKEKPTGHRWDSNLHGWPPFTLHVHLFVYQKIRGMAQPTSERTGLLWGSQKKQQTITVSSSPSLHLRTSWNRRGVARGRFASFVSRVSFFASRLKRWRELVFRGGRWQCKKAHWRKAACEVITLYKDNLRLAELKLLPFRLRCGKERAPPPLFASRLMSNRFLFTCCIVRVTWERASNS